MRLGVGQLRAGDFTVRSLRARAQPPCDAGGAPRQAASRGLWDPGEWLACRLIDSARASLRWNGVRGAWHALGRALGSILALCQQGARQRGASVARDREAWASCGTNATARGVGVPSWGVLSGRRSSRPLRVVVPVAPGWLRATWSRRVSRSEIRCLVLVTERPARPPPAASGTPASG